MSEKIYRVKPDYKLIMTGLVSDSILSSESIMSYWENETHIKSAALEEVPQRIELCNFHVTQFSCSMLSKKDSTDFKGSELKLCEKAINGELYDEDFCLDLLDYYEDNYCNTSKGVVYRDIVKEFKKQLKK